jgi:hypothetical protein
MQEIHPVIYLLFLSSITIDVWLLVDEVSIAHSDAPQPVGLLWTSGQRVAEAST